MSENTENVTPRSVLSAALVGSSPYNQAEGVLDRLEARGWTVTRVAPDATADGYDWPTTTDQPESVALEAHGHVYGDRQADYGHPREDFTRAAIIWTGLLQHKLADGAYIEAEDIGRCQIGTKLARDVHAPKRDNRVDMAGYAITLDRLETGK